MKKDAFYFSHDCNARNDVKILKLRRILGAKGYGIFWMLIEVLRESKEYKLPITIVKELSFDFRESEEIILTIINDFELFKIDNDYFFYSESLNQRMASLNAKRQKLSIAGKKGRQKQLELALNNEPVATPEHNDGPPSSSKVKESKENIYNSYYDKQIEISIEHENQLYKLFVGFLFKNNPTKQPLSKVLKLKDQISFETFDKWMKLYDKEVIKQTILDLENYTKKTYSSFTLTIEKWLQRTK